MAAAARFTAAPTASGGPYTPMSKNPAAYRKKSKSVRLLPDTVISGFSIIATQPWTDTGIAVTQGEQISVTVTGQFSCSGPIGGPGSGGACAPSTYGPDGTACSDPNMTVPSAPCFSVIGEITSPTLSTPFEVGAQLSLNAPQSGEFYLGVNDSYYPDNEGTLVATINVGPAPTPTPTHKPCTPGTPGPNLNKEIPLVNASGKPILNFLGNQVDRPDDGHDPEFFISEGERAGPVLGLVNSANFFSMSPIVVGVWDEQRQVPGVFDSNFIDYATIVIGLYAAAAGISESTILNAQNVAAGVIHNPLLGGKPYPKKVPMDPTYTNLPARNVFNTETGYSLYQSNAFGCG